MMFKRFADYSNYFFYLLWNWNIGIAWHIIRNDITGEKKYGISTTGADELNHLRAQGIDITHATIYMPASYDLLLDVFATTAIKNTNHFLDIGCGKGRVLCVAATLGVQKLSGIDLSKKFCEIAGTNLEKIKAQGYIFEWRLYNNDAFYFAIEHDIDCIFLFNPFDEVVMSAVIENIENSLQEFPRRLTIIYLNPIQKQLFLQAGFKVTYRTKKLNYLEAIVLQKSPGTSQG